MRHVMPHAHRNATALNAAQNTSLYNEELLCSSVAVCTSEVLNFASVDASVIGVHLF